MARSWGRVDCDVKPRAPAATDQSVHFFFPLSFFVIYRLKSAGYARKVLSALSAFIKKKKQL